MYSPVEAKETRQQSQKLREGRRETSSQFQPLPPTLEPLAVYAREKQELLYSASVSSFRRPLLTLLHQPPAAFRGVPELHRGYPLLRHQPVQQLRHVFVSAFLAL